MLDLRSSRIAIGRYVRLRRKDLEISQTELANEMGINRKTLAAIETGRTSFPMEAAPAAAKMLKLESPMCFLGQIGEGWN